MPKIRCKCGETLSYGDIPCPIEYRFMSDVDFDKCVGEIDAEELYRATSSMLECPSCKRLWVYWNGYQSEPTEYERGGFSHLDMDSYLKFVQSVAAERHKVFYLNHGEGKDYVEPGTRWYIEDLSGYLIDPEKTEAFEEYIEKGQQGNDWEDCFVFAIWTRDSTGKIGVEFRYWNYLNYVDADDDGQ